MHDTIWKENEKEDEVGYRRCNCTIAKITTNVIINDQY